MVSLHLRIVLFCVPLICGSSDAAGCSRGGCHADKRLGRSLLSLRTLKVVRLLLRHKASSLMLTRTAFQMLRRAKATRTLTAALTTLILTPTAMASPTQWRAAGMQTGILGSRRAPGGDGGALRPRRPKTGVGIYGMLMVIHLIQGCHCALLQKLCKMPKSQTLNPQRS